MGVALECLSLVLNKLSIKERLSSVESIHFTPEDEGFSHVRHATERQQQRNPRRSTGRRAQAQLPRVHGRPDGVGHGPLHLAHHGRCRGGLDHRRRQVGAAVLRDRDLVI